MIKAEKYKEKIKELDYAFSLHNGELKRCRDVRCNKCEFGTIEGYHCDDFKTKWLLEECNEKLVPKDGINYLLDLISPYHESVIKSIRVDEISNTVKGYEGDEISLTDPKYVLTVVLKCGYITIFYEYESDLYFYFENLEYGRNYTAKELNLL